MYGIVQNHGGWIEINSRPEPGSDFRIYLPLGAGRPNGTATPISVPDVWPVGTETILVAEDDPAVRSVVVSVLGAAGYRILSAPDGEAALSIFEAHEREVALVFTDLMMPRLGGRQLVHAVRQRRPDVRVLFTTGYDASSDRLPYPVLHKPYGAGQMLTAVRRALDGDGQDACGSPQR